MEGPTKLSCLVDDLDRYNLTFETYEKQAVSHGFKSWINQGLPDVVSQLKKSFGTTSDGAEDDEVRLLSVGSGTGRLDSQIVRQFQHSFRRIKNNLIEPSKEAISTYQALIADPANHLSATSCDWYNMTFDQYQTSHGGSDNSTAPRKFHFISAVHSLYYVDEPESAVSFLYDQLEDGGKLLIVMQDEESGIERIVRRFDLFNDAANQVDAFAAIRNHLQSVNIKYETHIMPASYDVTSCYKDTEQGSLILDFISHAAHFKQTASNRVQHDLLEYMKSELCSRVDGDRVLMDATEVALVITKS